MKILYLKKVKNDDHIRKKNLLLYSKNSAIKLAKWGVDFVMSSLPPQMAGPVVITFCMLLEKEIKRSGSSANLTVLSIGQRRK